MVACFKKQGNSCFTQACLAALLVPLVAAQVFTYHAGIRDGLHNQRVLRLAGALKIQTESYDVGVQNEEAFPVMHEYMRTSFPAVHGAPFVTVEVVNRLSLLYTVTGSQPNVMPYLFDGHIDVVPATPTGWLYPPYEGRIVNNTYIYGRGAMDDKGSIMGIFEALEFIIAKGEQPIRSFYITVGSDEEIGGTSGNRMVAQALRNRGVTQVDFIIDEGMPITRGLIPGALKPIAMVAVSEKGQAYVTLSVTRPGSHSSVPSWETSIGILATALSKLERNKFPGAISSGLGMLMLKTIAPYCDSKHRRYYENLTRYASEVTAEFERHQLTNAFVRTTTALTIIKGGDKENVVPGYASAVVNFRIHPSQTVQDTIDFMTATIADSRVVLNVTRSREAHPISPHGPGDLAYQLVVSAINQTFPDAVATPAVMVANTDARWYLDFSPKIYRLFPAEIGSSDVGGIHGFNERLTISNYRNVVDFYYRIIRNADQIWQQAPMRS